MSKFWRYRALMPGRAVEGVISTHPSLDYAFEARLFEEGDEVTNEWLDNPAKIGGELGLKYDRSPGEGHGGDGSELPPAPPPPAKRRRTRE